MKNQLTSGAWSVGAIQYVDETAKQVYFTARGKETGRICYYAHLYRVNYDGTGLTLITPEDAHHDIRFSPSGKYFVDTYSRIEKPPVTVLRAMPDGRVVRKLEEADVSRLAGIGWRPGQVFTVKARDGVTDLYGVMYLPPNIDSTKKYPIIDHIYPGPQVGSVGSWSFKNGGEQFALAELGFVVIQLDHLGTPLRSKAFHDNYYGNFGDNGLPDHITAIKQLASRYPFIDVDRGRNLRPLGRRLRVDRRDPPVSRLLQGRGVGRGEPRQPDLQHLLGGEVSGADEARHGAEDRQLRELGEQDDGEEPEGQAVADARRHGRQRPPGERRSRSSTS